MTAATPVGLLIILACLLAKPAGAQGVFVQAGEDGQGMLRPRGNECFVLTPLHVVAAALGAVRIVGERSFEASAELVRELPGDLAVLRITEAGLACPPLPAVDRLNETLTGQTSGVLTMRERDGSQTFLPVDFDSVNDEFIFVSPTRDGTQILKGMSGASLLVDGRVAGMLLSVENGIGTVYQLDDVLRVADGFFAPASAAGNALPDDLLNSLVGEYNAGSVMVNIERRPEDGRLTSRMSGQPPVVLEHRDGLSFGLAGFPDFWLEFRRDAGGGINEFLMHQPDGTPIAIRQSPDRPSEQRLSAFAGEYVAGTYHFVVTLTPAGVLTWGVQGEPGLELIFARDNRFMVRGSAGISIEFVEVAGAVTGLALHQPVGNLLAGRIAKQVSERVSKTGPPPLTTASAALHDMLT